MIPTYNRGSLVKQCVDHLTSPAIATITVVDDASDDDIRAALARRPVDVVRLVQQRGLAHALNRGAEAGSGRFILFVNNDIFALPGAVEMLVAGLQRHPEAASIGGRLVSPVSHSTQPSYLPRAIPGPAAVVARLTGLERAWSRNPFTGQHLRRPLPEDRLSVTERQPAGACIMVRRAHHEYIGGWDERFWIWYEDVDYSRRLLAIGPALYEPRARFEHVGGASTRHWDKPEQHRRLYHGTLHYSDAHFGRAGQRLVGTAAAAVALPRLLRYRYRSPRAYGVYQQVLTGGLALVRGATPPSMMEPPPP